MLQFDGLPNKSDAKNYMDERRQLDEEIEEFYEYYKLKNDKCMVCICIYMYNRMFIKRTYTHFFSLSSCKNAFLVRQKRKKYY